MSSYIRICCLIVLILITASCSENPTTPKFEEQIVINGYLYIGSAIDTIYVVKTLNINQPYTNRQAAISTDSIFISVDEKTYRLSEYRTTPGAYFLPKDSLIVQAGKEYHFRAVIGNRTVRASAVAPEQIKITELNTDSTYFPYPNPFISTPFKLSWNPTEYTAAYQIVVISRDHSKIVDYGLDQIIESHLEAVDYDTLRIFPAIYDFPINKFETSIEIFWAAFCYYGDYTLKLYAIDQNLWDMIASPVIYMSQSSEYEQPISHIEGGRGIFCAVSVDSVNVHVKDQK